MRAPKPILFEKGDILRAVIDEDRSIAMRRNEAKTHWGIKITTGFHSLEFALTNEAMLAFLTLVEQIQTIEHNPLED